MFNQAHTVRIKKSLDLEKAPCLQVSWQSMTSKINENMTYEEQDQNQNQPNNKNTSPKPNPPQP